MKWVREALFASALIGAVAGGSSALADPYLISHTGTITNDWESLNVTGVDANAPAVGIVFTVAADSLTDANGTLLVLCDDLFHTVSVPVSYGPGHELEFDSASLSGNVYYTHSGTQTFDLTQASLLGQLVTQAQDIYGNVGSVPDNIADLGLTNNQEIAAIQGAIWGIEYKTTVTDNNDNENLEAAIVDFSNEFTNHTTDGVGLYSTNGTQNQLLGVPIGTQGGPGVPEPASWLTMLLGVSVAGAFLRRKRALATVVA